MAQDFVRPVNFFARLFSRPQLGLSSFMVCTSNHRLPGLTVRPYRSADFACCLQLYKANEPGRFPAGFSERYAEYPAEQRTLILVAEQAGEVVGTAGINSTYRGQAFYYWLSYGLVAPRRHRQGIGTVLLLARIALLPEPARSWPVAMRCVQSSRSFYERFGFRHLADHPDQTALEAGDFLAWVKARQIRRARRFLGRCGIFLDSDALRIPLDISSETRPGCLAKEQRPG